MALDISDIGYRQQSRAIHDLWKLVDLKISVGLQSLKLSVVDVWNAKLRALAWRRKQLERLKPIGPMPKGLAVSKGGGLLVLDLEVDKNIAAGEVVIRVLLVTMKIISVI